jgi:uncharacterized protein YuzE
MATTEDLTTRIETTEYGECIFVDQFDDDVWLSVNVRGGGARCTITKAQAREMIAALQRVVDSDAE